MVQQAENFDFGTHIGKSECSHDVGVEIPVYQASSSSKKRKQEEKLPLALFGNDNSSIADCSPSSNSKSAFKHVCPDPRHSIWTKWVAYLVLVLLEVRVQFYQKSKMLYLSLLLCFHFL